MVIPFNEFVAASNTQSYTWATDYIISFTTDPLPQGVTVQWLDPGTATERIVVSYDGVDSFYREMHYVNDADEDLMVTRFVDLPPTYHALYKYVGAGAAEAPFFVHIVTKNRGTLLNTTHDIEYTVVMNYAVAMVKVKAAVDVGLY